MMFRVFSLVLLLAALSFIPHLPGQVNSAGALQSAHASDQARPRVPLATIFQDPQVWNYSSGPDLAPAALSASDGTIWVAWTSNRAGPFQIYYQTYDGIARSALQTISAAPFNSAPNFVQLLNGTIILIWAAGTSGSDNHLYYRAYTNGLWRSIVQLTFPAASGFPYADETPRAVVTRNSALWVFWERDASTGPSTPPTHRIYFKTLNGNTWSADNPVTTDSNVNSQPSPTVIKDGSILLTWSRATSLGGSSTIVYQRFDGTQGSPAVPLTSSGNMDANPDLVQDRNGTLWLFWSRPVALNSTVSQTQLFDKFSVDAGTTWSAGGNLTHWGNAPHPANNLTPFAIQGVDTSLYIFFASNIVPFYDFDIYYIQSYPIYPVHDVGVTGIQVSPANSYPAGRIPGAFYPYGDNPVNMATVSVTVTNYGDQNEPVTVSLQASNNTIYALGSRTGTVPASLSSVFTFTWNVTGISPGRYTLTASVPRLTGETLGNALDNILTVKSGLIIVYAGDVLRHGIVNINDEAVMGHCWLATPGSANWNPDCDILRKGIVNINDEAVAGGNWLKSI